MLKLTQELFGASDEELGRGGAEGLIETIQDYFRYFGDLTAERRAHPTDDLASLIANGIIDDQPVARPRAHELLRHHRRRRARHHGQRHHRRPPSTRRTPRPTRPPAGGPDLIDNAVDEMIRWVTPVRHFMRTAQADTTIGDTAIAQGDLVYLSYLAANRDPAVFDDPHRFDVARPNADRHIAFGFGVHFCLGAQLARIEMRTLYRKLIPRLRKNCASPASPHRCGRSSSAAPKSLPITYTLAPSPA